MGKYSVEETGIDGLKVITPIINEDARGYFYESYNKRDFEALGINMEFVQDNEARSTKNVLRGLHFQINHPQTKLVRCTKGKVFDVAVDLRKDSKTFGKYYGVELSAENKKMFLIPKNFAHGYYVMSDEAVFCYKVDDFYHPNDEGGIIWNDKEIGVKWPITDNKISDIIFSEKDTKWEGLDSWKKKYL